ALLHLVGAGLAARQLPAHDAVQDVRARLQTEHGVVQLHRAAGAVAQGFDVDLHYSPPLFSSAEASASAAPAASASAAVFSASAGAASASAGALPLAVRNAPGVGSSTAPAPFTASRTSIQPPFGPGT